MFADFYKLSGRPFQLNPDHRFFYGSRSHQKAMSYLNYGLHQGEGFIVITGDVGAGKTTLVGYLLSQLDGAHYVAGKVVTTQLDADDTLRMVASAFGLPHEGCDKATLLRRFEAFLSEHQRHHRRVLLLIDEAQNLPTKSLEELRMLSNFQVGEATPLQIFLLGQPQFRETLADGSLEQLRQRVIASHHLTAMDAKETRGYIEHRLHLVNWQDDPKFTEMAYQRIFEHTGGVPRRINTFCTRLLLFGAVEELHTIDEAVVEEVASDLLNEGARSAQPTLGHTGPPAAIQTNGYTNLPEEVARLNARVTSAEGSIGRHERTIKHALEMIARYVEQAGAGRE